MPPKTKNTPADEAAAEVETPQPITVPWRDVTITIPRDIVRDARFRLAVASEDPAAIVFEALGPAEANKLLQTLQRGEDAGTVLGEFLTAMREAAGWGNPDASS